MMNHCSLLFNSFNRIQKVLFAAFSILLICSFISIMSLFTQRFTSESPDYGGTYKEGMVGSPVVVNPLLATTDSDIALTRLLYSGLLRKTSWNNYISDLGKCVEVRDKPSITCTINENATFHDDTPIDADDIVFTINTAQAMGTKSPWKNSLTGITIQKIDEKTIVYNLPKKFSGFEEVLTLGILPKHIWRNTPIDSIDTHSTDPAFLIGSGPYKLDKQIQKKTSTSYVLQSFDKFILGEPFISTIELYFYPDQTTLESAFSNRDIDRYVVKSDLIHKTKTNSSHIFTTPIIHPDLYGVFTKYGSKTTDQQIKEIKKSISLLNLSVFGIPWDKTLPPWEEADLVDVSKKYATISKLVLPPSSNTPSTRQQGSQILATLNQGLLENVTQTVYSVLVSLQSPTELQIYDFNGFKNSIIPGRKFDYLVFGNRYRHISDLYAFWNAKERIDPGLNITGVNNAVLNINSEKLLSRRTEEAKNSWKQAEKILSTENVFTPLYLDRDIYLAHANNSLHMQKFIYNPTIDRFNQVSHWYIKTRLSLTFN